MSYLSPVSTVRKMVRNNMLDASELLEVLASDIANGKTEGMIPRLREIRYDLDAYNYVTPVDLDTQKEIEELNDKAAELSLKIDMLIEGIGLFYTTKEEISKRVGDLADDVRMEGWLLME